MSKTNKKASTKKKTATNASEASAKAAAKNAKSVNSVNSNVTSNHSALKSAMSGMEGSFVSATDNPDGSKTVTTQKPDGSYDTKTTTFKTFYDVDGKPITKEILVDKAAGNSATNLGELGIFGVPCQFNENSDPRGDDGWQGRVYRDYYLSNAPLVFFKVGKPKFMGNVEGTKFSALLEEMTTLDSSDQTQYIDAMFGNSKNNQMYYYTFDDDFDTYCKYVNAMVRFTAVKMGLDNKDFTNFQLNETKYRSSSWWKNFYNDALSLSKYVLFYANGSNTSYSESGSNSTGDSQLASSVKTMGQIKREADFLFGAATNTNDESTNYDKWSSNLKSNFSVVDKVDQVINRMTGTFTSIASGGNVLFPEIWQDSSYRSSYSVEIVLASPYGDKESIFRNIFIPFFCILAFSLPRQCGKQGYTSPFLIQCFSRGFFSCNLGMVDNIDIKKSKWTVDGYPTEITVSLGIKDLYPTIVASPMTQMNMAFANNTGMVEYLKMMAGVQLIDFDPTSNIEEALSALAGTLKDIPTSVRNKITSKLGEGAQAVIKSIFGGMN